MACGWNQLLQKKGQEEADRLGRPTVLGNRVFYPEGERPSAVIVASDDEEKLKKENDKLKSMILKLKEENKKLNEEVSRLKKEEVSRLKKENKRLVNELS